MAHRPVQHMQNTGHSWLEQNQPKPPYEVQEFPKTMHHKTKPAVTVRDAKAQAALGPEWAQSPAAFADEIAKEKAEAEKADADAKAKAKADADKADAKAKADADKAKAK